MSRQHVTHPPEPLHAYEPDADGGPHRPTRGCPCFRGQPVVYRDLLTPARIIYIHRYYGADVETAALDREPAAVSDRPVEFVALARRRWPRRRRGLLEIT